MSRWGIREVKTQAGWQVADGCRYFNAPSSALATPLGTWAVESRQTSTWHAPAAGKRSTDTKHTASNTGSRVKLPPTWRRRVSARNQPLRRRLLIARCAVDLSSQEEAPQAASFQAGQQLPGVDIVIFNGIGRHQHAGSFQACGNK